MKNITDLYLEMKKIMMVENTKFWYVGILDKKKKKKNKQILMIYLMEHKYYGKNEKISVLE